MNLIKNIRLYYQDGKSDKVYEVDLCELGTQQPDRYLVNFRYGKRGANLREGTKTGEPTDLENAQRIYDSIVVSKTNNGYRAVGDDGSAESQPDPVSDDPLETLSSAAVFSYLTDQLSIESDPNKKARLLWRLGDLQHATDGGRLIPSATYSNWLEQYSLIFALCRCSRQGDSNTINVLAKLCDSSNPTVSNFALHALLHVSDNSNRIDLLQQEKKALPAELMAIVTGIITVQAQHENHAGESHQATDTQKGAGQLLINYFDQTLTQPDIAKQLIALYRISLAYPQLHAQLPGLLKVLPLRPPFFKAIRHIFKAAEMTLDAPVFAAISYRLDTSEQRYNADGSHCYLPDLGYIKVKEEQLKANTKLAYSKQTRQYLRRRSWRCLRRLAEAGNTAYVPMAVEQLLQVADDNSNGDLPSGPVSRDPEVENVTNSQLSALCKHFAISQIIYGNSQVFTTNNQGASWRLQGDTPEQHLSRTERYPELWDQQAELVLPLLVHSRCHDIHKFAVRLLKDHAAVTGAMPMATLLALLNLPYPETNRLACEVARTRLQENGYDGELLLTLMSSVLPEARSTAIEFLGVYESEWQSDTTFIALQCFIEFDDIAVWRTNNLSSTAGNYSAGEQNTILGKIVEHCFKLGDLTAVQYENVSGFTAGSLAEAAASGSLLPVNRLLSEPEEYMQLYGADLLVLNSIAFEEIPESLFEKISQSPWARVRAKGIALIGKQSDEALLKNPDLLLGIYKQGEHLDRSEAAPIIVRMADKDSKFAALAVHDLVSVAFQTEKNEQQHEDIISLYKVDFKPYWSHIDDNLLWRLLTARSKAAQIIGSVVLTESPMAERMLSFSVMQWALLGHHQAGDVRQHVRNAYNDYKPEIRAQSRDALKILDGDWLDTREFAFEYFRDNYQAEDWNPDLIIYICDNNRDDVQAFGRELLQRTFTNDQGEGYLLKLSQHPATNVQLFASNFLREHAGGKPQVIKDLKLYFVTVLSQVNRARITKDRVFSFLMSEAQQDSSVAEMVADIFSRQSVTAVIKDKSTLIESLLQLQKLYPDVPMPLAPRQRPIWSRDSRHKNSNTQGVV